MIEPKPYLILPQLIEQPTWGGSYIADYKGWASRPDISNKKIGQSYELVGNSRLSLTITDSSDASFGPEVLQGPNDGTISLAELVAEDASVAFGPAIYSKYQKMPLLIKFTQAKGNSFQLHKKPDVVDPHWQPKAESWYFFEPGYITLGIKKGINPEDYKQVCKDIETTMKQLSQEVIDHKKTLEQASAEAKNIVHSKNPWQFINQYHVDANTLLDLSIGGLHHSWEEDPNSVLGNVLYEVQQDVADEFCTLRSFDQGKIKADGTVRTITIDDYFRFLDADEQHNAFEFALKTATEGTRLLTTKNYCMDVVTLQNESQSEITDSFVHLFVKEGDISVKTATGSVRVTKGHSCFVPQCCGSYIIVPHQQNSTVIKTFIESNIS